MFDIREDDLTGAETRALLALHLAGMHANSPPGSVFALDLSGLQLPGVTVWTARLGERIACVAALKMLAPEHGEVKSMRVHPDFAGQGAGAAILDHIIKVARTRGVARLSLETGTGPAFEAAVRLYQRRGFRPGAAFGGYPQTAFNQFFHLELARDATDPATGLQ
ncbi:MAG: putative acetyltransferase [Oceanicaulis sp. HLUCCA04]|nr:MAG: putative acetyltransferase [Oceanicaulis sp. HLUCCA04]